MRSTAAGLGAGVILWLTVLSGVPATAQGSPAPELAPDSLRFLIIIVQQGETLYAIARRYGVTVEAIVKTNGLRDPNSIRAGQTLRIPLPANRTNHNRQARPQLPPSAAGEFQWPARGPIMSGFGDGRNHTGIDISASPGTPITAARAGVVIHSGIYYEYGLTVILDHGGGVTTVYGHASILVVGVGQAVQAGEMIARVGCTGRCTGPHVHFEVRVGGRAVDPMTALTGPGRVARTTPPARETSGPPAEPPTDRMEVERSKRGGVEIIRYVTLTADTVVLTEDTIIGGRLVARVEDSITVRDGARVRIRKVYAAQDNGLTLVAEEVTKLDADRGPADNK